MIFQSIVIPVRYHNTFPKFVWKVIDLCTTYIRSNYKNRPEFPFNNIVHNYQRLCAIIIFVCCTDIFQFVRNILFFELSFFRTENQKGVNAVQQCSIENQKGAISIDFVHWYSALVVHSETSLCVINMGRVSLRCPRFSSSDYFSSERAGRSLKPLKHL